MFIGGGHGGGDDGVQATYYDKHGRRTTGTTASEEGYGNVATECDDIHIMMGKKGFHRSSEARHCTGSKRKGLQPTADRARRLTVSVARNGNVGDNAGYAVCSGSARRRTARSSG